MDVREVFEEHYDPLFRYLSRLTGDPDAAADAAQEAFVRLVEKSPADEQVRAWLFRVATNVVRDEMRVRQRRLELLREAPGRVPVADQPVAPDEALELQERRARVRSALNALSAKEQTILLMREEGFSHQEIAEAVETTTRSVGSMIARALQKLSVELTQQRETRK